jgi:polygalacturonase
MKLREKILLLLFLFTGVYLRAADFDITKYGAIGDGKTMNTFFIQKAIDECNKTGGGRVIFPAGKYLSGTIVLKDNVISAAQQGCLVTRQH